MNHIATVHEAGAAYVLKWLSSALRCTDDLQEMADAAGPSLPAEATWQAGPGRQDAFGPVDGAKPAAAKKRRVKRARLVSSAATDMAN